MARKTFLIDLGDSNDGPVGMVVCLKATTKTEAVSLAKKAIELAVGDCDQIEVLVPNAFKGIVEYINVYVNSDKISSKDVRG
jgi:hypothetical protein